MRNTARRHVDDLLTMPVDGEATRGVHLADDNGFDIPLLDQRHELVELLGSHDRAHALLRLAHQDLLRGESLIAQKHAVEPHVHAAVAIGGELTCRARDSGAAEILDALDEACVQYLEGGLDEQLLHERIAHLHARALGGAVGVEGLGGENRDAADAIATGACAIQDNEISDALRAREVDIFMSHRADAQGVDERVAEVGGVEDDLAADIREAQAVAVAADAADDAGQHAASVGRIERAEAQWIHHRERACAHRDDVAHDAADTGGRTLVRLDVRRMVVALDLEGDGPAIADVDDAGVLADADEQCIGLRGLLAELAQVHLRRLVRAVLTPHDRVHRELGGGRTTSEDLANALVLIGLEAELGEGLRGLGIRLGSGDGVGHQALTSEVRTLVKNGSPSVVGPVSDSTACSGWGMSPTTLPRSLRMPAMSRALPLGLTST